MVVWALPVAADAEWLLADGARQLHRWPPTWLRALKLAQGSGYWKSADRESGEDVKLIGGTGRITRETFLSEQNRWGGYIEDWWLLGVKLYLTYLLPFINIKRSWHHFNGYYKLSRFTNLDLWEQGGGDYGRKSWGTKFDSSRWNICQTIVRLAQWQFHN